MPRAQEAPIYGLFELSLFAKETILNPRLLSNRKSNARKVWVSRIWLREIPGRVSRIWFSGLFYHNPSLFSILQKTKSVSLFTEGLFYTSVLTVRKEQGGHRRSRLPVTLHLWDQVQGKADCFCSVLLIDRSIFQRELETEPDLISFAEKAIAFCSRVCRRFHFQRNQHPPSFDQEVNFRLISWSPEV